MMEDWCSGVNDRQREGWLVVVIGKSVWNMAGMGEEGEDDDDDNDGDGGDGLARNCYLHLPTGKIYYYYRSYR